MSVVRSFYSTARQVRANLSYRLSRLQSNVRNSFRYHLQDANEVVDSAVRNSNFTFFRCKAFHLDDVWVVSAGDSSDFATPKSMLEARPALPHHVRLEHDSTRLQVYVAGRGSYAPVRSQWWVDAQRGARGHQVRSWHGRVGEQRSEFCSSLAACRLQAVHEHIASPPMGKISDTRSTIDLASSWQEL